MVSQSSIKRSKRMIKTDSHKAHVRNIARNTRNKMFGYSEVESDNGKKYIKRYYKPHSRYYKKESVKTIRRSKDNYQNNSYRRAYDYWWGVI